MASERVVILLERLLKQYKLTKATTREEVVVEEAEIFLDSLHDEYEGDQDVEEDEEDELDFDTDNLGAI
jgi:hypothetical protein